MESISFQDVEQVMKLKLISKGQFGQVRRLTNNYIVKIFEPQYLNKPNSIGLDRKKIEELSQLKTRFETFVTPESLVYIGKTLCGYSEADIGKTHVNKNVMIDELLCNLAMMYEDICEISSKYNYLIHDLHPGNLIIDNDFKFRFIDLDSYSKNNADSSLILLQNIHEVNYFLIEYIIRRIMPFYEYILKHIYDEFSSKWIAEIGILLLYGLNGSMDAITFMNELLNKISMFRDNDKLDTLNDVKRSVRKLMFKI